MNWKEKARRLGKDIYVLYLALKDRRTPWYARVLIGAVVVYALSPVDLIPDFIPVVGYLDDLIVVPVGSYLALKMIPRELLREYRQNTADTQGSSE